MFLIVIQNFNMRSLRSWFKVLKKTKPLSLSVKINMDKLKEVEESLKNAQKLLGSLNGVELTNLNIDVKSSKSVEVLLKENEELKLRSKVFIFYFIL